MIQLLICNSERINENVILVYYMLNIAYFYLFKLNICCLAAGPSSRPHSSTSAEVEQGLATLSLSSPAAAATTGPPNTVQQVTSTRTKEASRYIHLPTK